MRRYEHRDQDEVWNLHVLALNSTENLSHIRGPWDEYLLQIEATYLANGGEFLVAEIDGVIVAMGALRRLSAQRAEIKRMRVHPLYWRKGIAQRILSRLEIIGKEKGYLCLELDTTTQQTAAQQLYLKHGFQETRRGQIGPFDFIFYEKCL